MATISKLKKSRSSRASGGGTSLRLQALASPVVQFTQAIRIAAEGLALSVEGLRDVVSTDGIADDAEEYCDDAMRALREARDKMDEAAASLLAGHDAGAADRLAEALGSDERHVHAATIAMAQAYTNLAYGMVRNPTRALLDENSKSTTSRARS